MFVKDWMDAGSLLEEDDLIIMYAFPHNISCDVMVDIGHQSHVGVMYQFMVVKDRATYIVIIYGPWKLNLTNNIRNKIYREYNQRYLRIIAKYDAYLITYKWST
ncbi:hypothetical protein JTB14_026544 [Gonioctena quinquepunctata]|nr:hypothetical protein JTB14_026544 [Gonioctena quinquepunctata]